MENTEQTSEIILSKGSKLCIEFYVCTKNGGLYTKWVTDKALGGRDTSYKKLQIVAAWLEELKLEPALWGEKSVSFKFEFVQGAANALYTHTAPTVEGVGYGRSDLENQLVRAPKGEVWEATLNALFAHCINVKLPQAPLSPQVTMTSADYLEYLRSNDSNWAFQTLVAIRAISVSKKLAGKSQVNVCAAFQKSQLDMSTLVNSEFAKFVTSSTKLPRKTFQTVKQGALKHNGMWYEDMALMQSSFQCAIKVVDAIRFGPPDSGASTPTKDSGGKGSGGKTAKSKVGAQKASGILYVNSTQWERPVKGKLGLMLSEAAELHDIPENLLFPSIREAQFVQIARVAGELRRFLVQSLVDRMYHWDDLGFILFRLPHSGSILKWQSILDVYFQYCDEHLMVRNSFGFLEPAINAWEDGYLRLTPGCMTTRNVWAFAMAMNAKFADQTELAPCVDLKNEDVVASQAAWRTHLAFAVQCGFQTRAELSDYLGQGGAKGKPLTSKLIRSLDNNIGKGIYLLGDSSVLKCARPVKTISSICQIAHIARCHLELIAVAKKEQFRYTKVGANGPFLLDSGLQCGVVGVLPGLLKGFRLVTSVNAQNSLYFEYLQNDIIKAVLAEKKTEGFLDYDGKTQTFFDDQRRAVTVSDAVFFLTPGGMVSPHAHIRPGEACQDLPALIKILSACPQTKLLVFDLTTVRHIGTAALQLLNAFPNVPTVLFFSLAKFSQMGQDKYQGGQLCFNDIFAKTFPDAANLFGRMHLESRCRAREIYFELMQSMKALDPLLPSQ